VPSIHDVLYRYSYQLSIFIYEVFVTKPQLTWNYKPRRTLKPREWGTRLEKQLSCFVVGHGNLLVACVKITT